MQYVIIYRNYIQNTPSLPVVDKQGLDEEETEEKNYYNTVTKSIVLHNFFYLLKNDEMPRNFFQLNVLYAEFGYIDL